MVTVAVTFLVTLVLRTSIEYFAASKGTVLLGPFTTIQSQIYMPVDIANFRYKPLDNLVLSIPKLTDIPEIVSSSPIQIEEVPDVVGTSDRKRIQISGLEPNQITRLLIPTANQNEAELFRVVNAKQVGLAIEPVEHIQSPIVSALEKELFSAAVTSILFGLLMLGFLASGARIEERLKEQVQESKQESQALNARVTKLTQNTEEVRKNFYRVKVLLFARLSDYSKELDFWRDTIRKILYQTTGENTTSEMVISQVTRTLKTYGTLRGDSVEDFEAIKVLAGILSDSREPESETTREEP